MVAPLCMIFGCDMLMWQKAGFKYTISEQFSSLIDSESWYNFYLFKI